MKLANRREILAAAGAVTATAGAFLAGIELALAEDATPERSEQFGEALARIIGPATPAEDGILLDLPELAENGNIVPYKIDAESPMTEADHISRLYLLSTANPQALVATFHFTPQSGKAAVTGRMRLAKTQDVVAVAETNTGKIRMTQRNVKVTIGGCGND